MTCVAEFGIIDDFEKDKDYAVCYEPMKYHCVAIDDDILNDWWSDLTLIRTYFHSMELTDLMTLLRRAIAEQKYVIHYGV
ncbi:MULTISPECIES: hypothetical protein [unclassified Paenibacillus]|uniref:hypothetical protein n=1 Tax=unclassified Paenibacillus TaxID=185978 RepID=UPI00311A29AE